MGTQSNLRRNVEDMSTLGIIASAKRDEPEDGDYCRYYQEIIRVRDGEIRPCNRCDVRCIRSLSREERDHLVRKKK